jgi:heme oxygenase
MRRASSVHEEMRYIYRILFGQFERKRSLEKPKG